MPTQSANSYLRKRCPGSAVLNQLPLYTWVTHLPTIRNIVLVYLFAKASNPGGHGVNCELLFPKVNKSFLGPRFEVS